MFLSLFSLFLFLFNSVSKSTEELHAQKVERNRKLQEKAERRKQQQLNVERKEREKEHHRLVTSGKAKEIKDETHDADNENDEENDEYAEDYKYKEREEEEDDDVEYYKQEVGEEPNYCNFFF